MSIESVKKVFIVGIKGVGMANIAIVLKEMGKQVVGSDTLEEFTTDTTLEEKGVVVTNSFESTALPNDVDLLIYSASHHGSDNPQVIEAKKRGVSVMHQAEFLGQLMGEFKTPIAVCGTHGKTTTASLLAFLLKALDTNPTYIVGTSSFNDVPGGKYGSKEYFVLEADEYGVNPPQDKTPKLTHLHPAHIICTSIGFDHPDVYTDIEHTKKEFLKFFEKVATKSSKKHLFLCADDPNIMEVAKSLPEDSYTTFGFSPYSHYMVSNIVVVNESMLFDLTHNGVSVESFSTKLLGDKSATNIAGVIGLLSTLGFDTEAIHTHLPEFTGAKRRFEFVGSKNGVELYDDYAHHPHEIMATLEAARARFVNRRIIVIFQPHTFSRTEALKREFVEALSLADEAYIAPIFASAREDASKFHVTSQTLAEIANSQGITTVHAYQTKEDLLPLLRSQIKGNEVIFTMGAGDIYKLKNDIISTL